MFVHVKGNLSTRAWILCDEWTLFFLFSCGHLFFYLLRSVSFS